MLLVNSARNIAQEAKVKLIESCVTSSDLNHI